jgi:hypothetical protein
MSSFFDFGFTLRTRPYTNPGTFLRIFLASNILPANRKFFAFARIPWKVCVAFEIFRAFSGDPLMDRTRSYMYEASASYMYEATEPRPDQLR